MRIALAALVVIPGLVLAIAGCKKPKGDGAPGEEGTTGAAGSRVGTGTPIAGEPVKTACDLKAHDLAEQSHAIDGKSFLVRCPAGCAEGTVWGTDLYTDDSAACRSAVHAGAIPASGGVAAVTFVRGQVSYAGSQRNGVASSDYGRWPRSYYVQGIDDKGRAIGAAPTIYDDRTGAVGCGAANPFGGSPGEVFTAVCPADCTQGTVWGSNPYTSDSSLCAAAHHAGLLDGKTRKVKLTLGGPLKSFKGTTANGVTTNDYGPYGSSVTLSKAE
jgi:hypothetical protein